MDQGFLVRRYSGSTIHANPLGASRNLASYIYGRHRSLWPSVSKAVSDRVRILQAFVEGGSSLPRYLEGVMQIYDESRLEHHARYDGLSHKEATYLYMQEFKEATKNPVPSDDHLVLERLDDEQFRLLTGAILFGRDYTKSDGDPIAAFLRFIRESVIYPRREQEAYLSHRPLGQYLREATEKMAHWRDYLNNDDDDSDY